MSARHDGGDSRGEHEVIATDFAIEHSDNEEQSSSSVEDAPAAPLPDPVMPPPEGAAVATSRPQEHHHQATPSLEGLEALTCYLNTLDDKPCCILDPQHALSYASYPHTDRNGAARRSPERIARKPVRVYNNVAMLTLLRSRIIIDALTARSQAVLREFLLDLSRDACPRSLKLEFVGLYGSSLEEQYSIVLVDFTIGSVADRALPRSLRGRYPRGLTVLTGTARRDADHVSFARSARTPSDRTLSSGRQLTSSKTQSSAGASNKTGLSDKTQGSGSTGGSPGHDTPATIAFSKRQRRGGESLNMTELTAFNFDSFRQTSCLVESTETGRLFLNYDWATTSLGPRNTWPTEYMGYINLALSIPSPTTLALGPEFIQIYNDAYADISGDQHPAGFGKPMAEAWGHHWKTAVQPLVAKAIAERKSYAKEDHLVWQQSRHVKHGVDHAGKSAVQVIDEASLSLLETYHTFSYTPLISPSTNKVDGFVALDADTTESVIARRRLATARDLQLAIAPALSINEFYDLAIGALESNPIDLPWVMMFDVRKRKPGQDVMASTDSGTSEYYTHTDTVSGMDDENYTGLLGLRLKASCGVLSEHVADYSHFVLNVEELEPGSSDARLPFPFGEAIRSGRPTHTVMEERVAEHFLPRSWSSITKRAAVCPIIKDGKIIPEAIMVVGLNTRRVYKETYWRFLEELSRCLTSGLASAQKVIREQRHLVNLRKLDEAKMNFFTGVSHELRTPLTLINAPAADALAENELSPANRSRYNLILKASNRMLRLVNSLLDFASLDAGKAQTMFRPVYLATVVQDLASLFRSAIERANLTFICDIQAEAVVYTDLVAFEKIFYNLLSNALKYTSQGQISVKCWCEEDRFIMEVADTGFGIPEDQLSLIFKRFHRIENKSARSIEGTGIGLALTRELARLLEGNLTVESKPDSGSGDGYSIFRLSLRLGTAHLRLENTSFDESPAHHPDRTHAYSRRGIADELTDTFEGVAGASVDEEEMSVAETGVELVSNREANVLVVDDHVDLRNYITSVLSGASRSVTGVGDGEAALAILRTNARIDLVVSDIMMPKMDGFQLLAEIRKDPTLAQLPVILLSARSGAEATADGIELGATDYLPKPFSSKELIARVRNALSNAKNSRRLEALVHERTAELVASERRAEGLMSILPVGVFEASSEGYVLYSNEAFGKMSRWDEARGFYIDDWCARIRAEDRTALQRILQKAIDAGRSVHAEESKGTYVTNWQWAETPQGVGGSHCLCQIYATDHSIVGVLTDITPSVRLTEQALSHEKQRATDAMNLARSQESFLDVVSHELRNPLSAILNCADLCTANHETIAAVLDQIETYLADDSGQRMLEELRAELDEAAEGVQGIIASARHQSLIAGDILSVSKFNRGLLTVTPIDICLSRELSTILSMFEIQTRNNSIKLELNLSPEISPTLCVSADPTRLTQILVNLISNSCRILENHDGFRRCTVECHASSVEPQLQLFQKSTSDGLGRLDRSHVLPANAAIGSDVWLLFLVRDSGPGISTKTQGQLFTKFNQAQAANGSMGATRSAVGGGAGLGLYLAKKLAELMGGSMIVTSVLGEGADFIFSIKASKSAYVEPKDTPRHRLRTPKLAQRAGEATPSSRSSFSTISSQDANSAPERDSRAPSPFVDRIEALKRAQSPPIGNRSQLRVLICEDNLLNQRLLNRQLTKAGIENTVANNGLEAVEKLLQAQKANRPMNVCLMDLEMPVCGGIEAATKIRSLEKTGELVARLIIYAVTGNARTQHADACAAAGMDDTIVKPYSFKDLLARLETLNIA